MPVYLKSIGFSVTLIGVLEGFALFTAGMSKGYFGKLSDTTGKRMPFVRLGYFLSAISKPLMSLAYPVIVFTGRLSDRLGKGIRTNARDAILSSETTLENKGKVFGFHQSFDTIGAAIGPLAALAYLYYYPGHYKALFLIAFLPAMAGVLFTFLIRDKPTSPKPGNKNGGLFSFLGYWKTANSSYKMLVPALLFFALMNSSDTFLLLMMKNQGLTDVHIILVYAFYNIIFAIVAYPAGIMGDKFGLKPTFIIGCILFSVVYCLFPFTHSTWVFAVLFLLYGIYAAATDGISRAWISNLSQKDQTATALGFYTGLASICTLAASISAGILWDAFGPKATFLVPGIGVLILVIYMIFIKVNNTHPETPEFK
jgi:MFS family permease